MDIDMLMGKAWEVDIYEQDADNKYVSGWDTDNRYDNAQDTDNRYINEYYTCAHG